MKGGITATAECWHALMRFLDSAAVVTSQPAFSMTMTPMRVATCARCRAAMRYWFHPSLQRRRLLLLVLQRTLFSNWRRVRYYCCCCSWTRPSCTHDIINLDTTYTDLTVGCHKKPCLVDLWHTRSVCFWPQTLHQAYGLPSVYFACWQSLAHLPNRPRTFPLPYCNIFW